MKIKITKIEDPVTSIPINSQYQRIEQIKHEISNCREQELCEVEVFDMWDGLN